jgi:hypothetical protein
MKHIGVDRKRDALLRVPELLGNGGDIDIAGNQLIGVYAAEWKNGNIRQISRRSVLVFGALTLTSVRPGFVESLARVDYPLLTIGVVVSLLSACPPSACSISRTFLRAIRVSKFPFWQSNSLVTIDEVIASL